MRLVEKEYCYIIEDFFPSGVVAGFTKPLLKGILPNDVSTALSFLGKDIGVCYMKQMHSSGVHRVDSAGVYEGDALYTARAGLALTVKTADCLPLIFSGRTGEYVGVAHMGWRSAKDGIVAGVFSDKQEPMIAAGVGLRSCCYRVGGEFIQYRGFKECMILRGQEYHFDPVCFVRNELSRHSVKVGGFCDLGMCSLCGNGNFFSYRRDATPGRTLSFIVSFR